MTGQPAGTALHPRRRPSRGSHLQCSAGDGQGEGGRSEKPKTAVSGVGGQQHVASWPLPPGGAHAAPAAAGPPAATAALLPRMGPEDCPCTGPGHRDNTKASRRLAGKVRGERPASRPAGLTEMGIDAHRTGAPLKPAPASARDPRPQNHDKHFTFTVAFFLLL